MGVKETDPHYGKQLSQNALHDLIIFKDLKFEISKLRNLKSNFFFKYLKTIKQL